MLAPISAPFESPPMLAVRPTLLPGVPESPPWAGHKLPGAVRLAQAGPRPRPKLADIGTRSSSTPPRSARVAPSTSGRRMVLAIWGEEARWVLGDATSLVAREEPPSTSGESPPQTPCVHAAPVAPGEASWLGESGSRLSSLLWRSRRADRRACLRRGARRSSLRLVPARVSASASGWGNQLSLERRSVSLTGLTRGALPLSLSFEAGGRLGTPAVGAVARRRVESICGTGA
mmetsp:Transcript_102111/g.264044  ORF Transcript_102111/g.264044 Transcript_102111/m.264044 type:complete len:232 (-) Transcript_102111:372-1067(-)